MRVHPEIVQAQELSAEWLADEKFWEHRFRSITDLEKHLHRNGTRVVIFFLHLSKEEQRQCFLARIDEPEKNWKVSQADIEQRKFLKYYMRAYEKCLSATSTENSPWHVVPADDKENARLIIFKVVLDTLESLKLSYPEITKARRKELLAIRKSLG